MLKILFYYIQKYLNMMGNNIHYTNLLGEIK